MSTVEKYGVLFPTSVVGSMPRPDFVRELLTAESAVSDAKTRHAMNAAVAHVVTMQEVAGLDVVTDGEWRRASYIGVIAELAQGFQVGTNPSDGRPWTTVVEKLEPKEPGFIAAEARFLKDATYKLTKVTLPAPALLGERMWDPERSRPAYPTRQSFVEACIPILRRELELVCAEGVDVVQIDDPYLCLFVDPQVRSRYADADAEADFSVAANNALLEGLEGVTRAVHLCRRAGARVRGDSFHSGGYEVISSQINRLNADHLTMEFASPAAGTLEALAGLREDLEIGLGCISVEPGVVDTKEAIVSRVEGALQVLSPERVVLNPDCGFAPGSAARVDVDEVYQKLKEMVAAAEILRERYG
jgi:5-methyltetrahydropteroyltriglutamate--homocysteine methyltransferase